uniref:Uncharacterized protein n=1 Tax=Rhizophora mucronata TaxID=61149 RepID=A0A2P2QM78_RHIMU
MDTLCDYRHLHVSHVEQDSKTLFYCLIILL